MFYKPLVATLAGLLLAQAYSYSSTIVGDVRIQTLNNGSLFCDSMICPPGTATCQVTKRNDPNNFQVIIRHRKCLDGNGVVLDEQTQNDVNPYGGTVNVNVVSGSGIQVVQGGSVRQMTPEEKRELEEHLRLTQERVQAQIGRSMNELQSNLAPFLDGSFAENLNKHIRTSIRNSFFY